MSVEGFPGGVRRATAPHVTLLAVFLTLGGLFAITTTAPAAERPQKDPSGNSPTMGCPGSTEFNDTLSLAQAIDSALCRNARIRAAWENIQVAAAAVDVTNSAYLPTLSANIGELNDRTGYPDSPIPASESTGHMIYASFDWRLFDFGGRSATHKAARLLLEAAVQGRDATIQKTLGSVVDAYFSAITARAELNERTEDESISQETQTSTQRRLAAGQGSQNDVLQASAALARSRLEKSRAISAYEKAKALLAYVTGIPVDQSFDLPEDVDVRTGLEAKDLAQWLQDTQRNHPAILAAEANVEAAQQRVTVARSAGLPYIDWTADFYQNGFPNQGLATTNTRVATVGVSVTIPLFDGFLSRHNVEEAHAAVRVSEAQLDDTRDSTSMAVIQAYSDARASLRNLEDSEILLNSAQAAFESSRRRYTQGATDITELLNAQTTLSSAKNERIRCISEWRAARLDLLSSAGVLSRGDVNSH